MNKPALSVFNFSMVNQADDSVDINIDGYIVDSPTLEMYKAYWGDETSVSYKSFRDSIPSGVKTINLFVNSGGGHVGDAMAIKDHLDALESQGVTVNREGRGIVASAATYPVMGKNSRLSENCLFMIHEVSGFAYGDVSSMENQVKAMRKFNDMIVDFYSKETGLSATVIGNMMKAETWMTAQDAVDKNFVKAKGPNAVLTNSIKAEHWPSNNTAMLNVYNSFFSNSNSNEMDAKKITDAITNGFAALMENLGLKDKAGDEKTTNALTAFTTSITNALTAGGIPDEASIKTMVDNAITEAFKAVPENFTKAITDANKDLVTKDEFKNALTKADLTTELNTFKTDMTNSIIASIGGKSEAGEKDKPKNSGKKVFNRFVGAQVWTGDN